MYARAMPKTVHVANTGILDRHPANNSYKRFNGEMRGRMARYTGSSPRTRHCLAC